MMVNLSLIPQYVKQLYPRSLPIRDVEVIRLVEGFGWQICFTLGAVHMRAFVSERDIERAARDTNELGRLLYQPFAELQKLQKDAAKEAAAKERATLLGNIDARIARFEAAIAMASMWLLRVRRLGRAIRRGARKAKR
jgi:hypothetical protein